MTTTTSADTGLDRSDRSDRSPARGTASPAATTAWSPPSELAEFEIQGRLGAGQMGQVFRARDRLLDRPVAVKFLALVEGDVATRERFLVEARAAARIQHPNVVGVYRVGDLDGRPFLVSEFVEGVTLDHLERPLPWARVLTLGIDLARGLAAAHRRGVLHRDIKPANAILTAEGHAKLLDFGLAKLLLGRAGEGAASSDALLDTTPREPELDVTTLSQRAAAALAGVSSAETVMPEPADAERIRLGQLSNAGALIGTPDYMAPEGWRGVPATRASDVYSLGALLWELCTGRVPFGDIPIHQLVLAVMTREPEPLAVAAPEVDARFAGIVDRCLRRDPALRFASADDLRAALESLTERAASASDLRAVGNPYRGLRAFDAQDAPLFFGREAEIGLVVDRLRAESCVVVAGDSGVGKSSLCRAGVLPRALDGGLEPGRMFEAVTLRPGPRPFHALVSMLAGCLSRTPSEVAAYLGRDPWSLGALLRPLTDAKRGLLIYVDQLEELDTLTPPAERERADRTLAVLASGLPGVRVLGSVRADYLTRLCGLPSFGAAVERGLFILRALGQQAVRDAILGPAHATGLRFESDELVSELVHGTRWEGGGLPLLQFALSELWDRRDVERNVIPRAALEALGGVGGALARHADGVLAAMRPAQRRSAWRVLSMLVTPDGTRARRGEHELCEGDADARLGLTALVEGRLLTALEGDAGSAFELAHEVLLSDWSALRDNVAQNAERRAAEERLRHAAAEWNRLGRTKDVLWGARQLLDLEIIGPQPRPLLESEFVRRSRRAARLQRWRRPMLAGTAALLALVTYAAVEMKNRSDLEARVEKRSAEAGIQHASAVRSRAEALGHRARAFVLFDEGARAAAEAAWDAANAHDRQAERTLTLASQRLEGAVALGPAGHAARRQLAEVIFERALLREAQGFKEGLEELLQRLELYDDDGVWRRAFDAPGVVSFTAHPAGARLSLYRRAVNHAWERLPVGDGLPQAMLELPRGSYLAKFSAPGRATVRQPFIVGRGQTLAFSLELPTVDRVPPGFVFIPEGAFLFGSTASDSLRRGFFEAPPVHPARTGAYLISRHEVTVADWLTYLEALDGQERARRTPGAQGTGVVGATLRLEREARGWRYTYKPGSTTLSAGEGELIRYIGRERRAAQRWRAFPVTAISAADAEAYAQWLSSTGRVRRARLCTEREWERAARGADDREFPHGDRLEPDDANFDETYGRDPAAMGLDEVGSHPRSRSPFGLDDMMGNAFEWVRVTAQPGAYSARGGSYFYDRNSNQVTNRQNPNAALREPGLGFRVCADVAPR